MQKSPGGKDYPMPSAVRHSRPLVILKCKMSSGKEQSRWWIGCARLGGAPCGDAAASLPPPATK